MKIKRLFLCLMCVTLTTTVIGACGRDSQALKDGYYTAKAADDSKGWWEYVTIMVQNGEIVSTEYNAMNASGFIKSWDNVYMQNMLPVTGTYPNEYTRYYGAQLTGTDGNVKIDALSGASSSYNVFQKLAYAVVEQARKGDSNVVQVPTA